MKVGSLFSGIGGLDLGLERAGMEVVWQVENNEFCSKILEKHWSGVRRYGDIRTIDPGELESIDLLCGGFPCQPASAAGKRKGIEDERWLWPEFARIISGTRPRWILAENVPGLLSVNSGSAFGEVLRDLASLGYRVEWDCIPAAAIGAPHRRDRVWIVAHTNNQRGSQRTDENNSTKGGVKTFPESSSSCSKESPSDPNSDRIKQAELDHSTWSPQRYESSRFCGFVPDAYGGRTRSGIEWGNWGSSDDRIFVPDGKDNGKGEGFDEFGAWWETEPDVGRVADGVSKRVDRLRGLGNAVVPQLAEWIGRRIMEADNVSATVI